MDSLDKMISAKSYLSRLAGSRRMYYTDIRVTINLHHTSLLYYDQTRDQIRYWVLWCVFGPNSCGEIRYSVNCESICDDDE
jgi:hypothetical protein